MFPDFAAGSNRIFHGECNTCRERETTGSTVELRQSLCPFCCHLRLRHLLFCVKSINDDDKDEQWAVEIRLGFLSELIDRAGAGCHLCGLIVSVINVSISLNNRADVEQPDTELSTAVLDLYSGNPDPDLSVRLHDKNGNRTPFYGYLRSTREDSSTDVSEVARFRSEMPYVGPVVRWENIKKLLHHCFSTSPLHSDCQKYPRGLEPPPRGFRLIDIDNMKLAQITTCVPFVALSYVWGKVSDGILKCTVSNVEFLETDGSLRNSQIPVAISDAVDVCKRLGQRYLWADRLCIVQDDNNNIQDQLNAMGAIYSAADFVLTLVSGASMNDRIPGVKAHRVPVVYERTVKVDGLVLETDLPNLEQAIQMFKWASRAWTYQENYLAIRKLYMTSLQLIYQCNLGETCEELSLTYLSDEEFSDDEGFEDWDWSRPSAHPTINPFAGNLPIVRRSSNNLREYISHISRYNTRSLTVLSDIYNAIQGIGTALYGKLGLFNHGLPLHDPDKALLWYPKLNSMMQEHPVDPPRLCISSSPNTILPSWSWSSIEGDIGHPILGNPNHFLGSVIHCAQILSNHTIKQIDYNDSERMRFEDPFQNLSARHWSPANKSFQIHMAIAVAEGCIKLDNRLEPKFWTKSTFRNAEASFVERWPTYAKFRAESSINGECRSLDISRGLAIYPTMIVVQVQVASFGIGMHAEHTDSGNIYTVQCEKDLEIRNKAGQCIGMLVASPLLSAENSSLPDSDFEFIGVSLGAGPWFRYGFQCLGLEIHNTDMDLYRQIRGNLEKIKHLDITFWDLDENPLVPVPVMNVMLIERRGQVRRRVSVGWILLTHWTSAERVFETIILE
jgi:hypothetical protein